MQHTSTGNDLYDHFLFFNIMNNLNGAFVRKGNWVHMYRERSYKEERGRLEAHGLLMKNYFVENPIYSDKDFNY